MQRSRFTLLSVFTAMILLASLVTPQAALAQDETPPPDSAPTQTTDGIDAAPTDTAPTDAPAVTDEPPATQADVATDEATATDETTATEEPAATQEATATDIPAPAPTAQEPASVSEILDQVPDGTDVVVLGTDGQPEPLASQVAADTIVNGDPMWCPAGVLPGGAGCTSHFTSFTDLIAELTDLADTGMDGVPSGAGTIYIDSNYTATGLNPDAGTDIIFDYGNNALTDLVFQGGWDFTPTVNRVVGTSDLSGITSLQFWDWGAFGYPASLTLRDIVLSGGDGLYIGDSTSSPITTANVTLQNVTVNGANGVTGTNAGTFIGTDGAVTVTGSNFSDNTAADGLDVLSGGNITLNNITANGNDGAGAVLASCGCLSAGDISVSGGDFSSNGDVGLVALSLSTGAVTLNGVHSTENAGPGIFAQTLEGDITLNNVTADHNGDAGAVLGTLGNVSVTGGSFSNNFDCGCFFAGTGLAIQVANDVSLTNVTANGNDLLGADVQADGDVTVCGGSYSNNGDLGLGIDTTGTAIISGDTVFSGNGTAPTDITAAGVIENFICSHKKTGDYKLLHVNDGESVDVNCDDGQIGVELHLPNGDSLIVPCPMRGPASLLSRSFSQLPAGLPDGFTFVSGLEAQAARDGLTVSFVMPAPDADYTIVHWNGTTWVELEGVTTVDGMFAVVSVTPGVYVLATK